MASLAEKEQEIEAVRDRLHLLVVKKLGDFSDREVTELSTYLDKLIVEYEMACTHRPARRKSPTGG